MFPRPVDDPAFSSSLSASRLCWRPPHGVREVIPLTSLGRTRFGACLTLDSCLTVYSYRCRSGGYTGHAAAWRPPRPSQPQLGVAPTYGRVNKKSLEVLKLG